MNTGTELLGFPFSLLRESLRVLFSPKLFKYFFFLLMLGLVTFPANLYMVTSLNIPGSETISLENWQDLSRVESLLKGVAPSHALVRKPGTWAWQAGRSLYRRFLKLMEFALVLFSKVLFFLIATAATLLILLFTWEFFFLERFILAILEDHPVFREFHFVELGLWKALRSATRCLYHLIIFILFDIFIWLAALIFPPFILVGMIFSCWRLGREFYLLPLEVKGFPVEFRETTIRAHNRETLVHGVCLKILLYLPGGFFFLPGAYALSIAKLGGWGEIRRFSCGIPDPEGIVKTHQQ